MGLGTGILGLITASDESFVPKPLLPNVAFFVTTTVVAPEMLCSPLQLGAFSHYERLKQTFLQGILLKFVDLQLVQQVSLVTSWLHEIEKTLLLGGCRLDQICGPRCFKSRSGLVGSCFHLRLGK